MAISFHDKTSFHGAAARHVRSSAQAGEAEETFVPAIILVSRVSVRCGVPVAYQPAEY